MDINKKQEISKYPFQGLDDKSDKHLIKTSNNSSKSNTSLNKEISFLQRKNRQLQEEILTLQYRLQQTKEQKTALDIIKVFFRFIYQQISFIRTYMISNIEYCLTSKSKIKIISFDIFDTLLRRQVHPEEVKLATSQYIFFKYIPKVIDVNSKWDIYNKRLDIENKYFHKQGDYNLHQVLEQLLHRLNIDNPDILKDIINYELYLEHKVIKQDYGIKKYFKKFNKLQNKLFLSDFYIPKKDLSKLLSYYYPDLKKGYVSCDYNKTKASGELFDLVLKENNCKPNEMLHIGDNKLSDYTIPKRKGIKALRYFHYKQELERREFSNKWDKRRENFPYKQDLIKLLKKISLRKTSKENHEEELFNLGVKYAPIFYSFVLNVLEAAQKEGIDKVYYFTREGVFFKKIHEEILKYNKTFNTQPELLEVSRLSTFFASIEDFKKEEFTRLWAQYKKQSPEAFFKSLNIKKDMIGKYLERYKIEENKIMNLKNDKNFGKLFNDKDFITSMTKILKERKELFEQYLKSKNISDNGNKYLVVDIGWRGTIQDNLGHILKNSIIIGKYLGLHRSYYSTLHNVFKDSYGPNFLHDSQQAMDIVNWTGVWEMLTNTSVGSISGYKKNPKGVKAIFSTKREEQIAYEKYIKHFQEGIIFAIKDISQFIEKHALSSDELRPYVLNLMSKIVYKPEHILTKVYFSLKHDETFGLGKFTDFEKLKDFNYKNLLSIRKFYRLATETCWRNGFWEYHKINNIMSIFLKIRKFLKGK